LPNLGISLRWPHMTLEALLMIGEAITGLDESLYQYGGYVSNSWLVALRFMKNLLSCLESPFDIGRAEKN